MSDRNLHARALEVFGMLLDAEPAQHDAIMARECRGDPALQALVRELLAADDRPSPLLDSGASELMTLVEDDAGLLPFGGVVGGYRLLRVAGHGGMATVYEAERDAGGVQQRVALKVVRHGLDTAELLQRFRRETRVLASLEHPNIARFHDAGSTPDGRSFLVMEYIEGQSLTAFCDERALPVRARLGLFRTVCDAVRFAHQRLIVHRDLKPSNILVTSAGTVKLLDFGIAKLLDEEADAGAPLTRTGVRLLTPEYAAPEQLRGEPISTAADVYALGLLLYELLVGRPARGAHAPAADFPSPSSVIRRAQRDGHGEGVAAARCTTPDRLRRLVQGDLDRIVQKALEPEPARRYGSADQLLDDLERFEAGLPVRARPQTLTYLAARYARRHRVAVGGIVLGVALMGTLGAWHTARITHERDRAQHEAAKSQATTQFLQRLLGDAYPSVALGDTFSMGDLLTRATARVDSLAGQPEVQAELLRTIGDIYREQGRFRDGLVLLERAVSLHRSSGRPPDRAAGQALSALGHLQHEAKDFQAAYQSHRESLDVFRRVMADDDSLVLYALNNIATAATELGDRAAALEAYEDVLAKRRRLFADTSQLVHVTHNNLGHLHDQLGNVEDAEREFRTALRIRRDALPPDHPATALTMNNLAALLSRTGRLEEAEALNREAMTAFIRVYGPDHHRVGLAAFTYGRLLQRMGRLAEADSLLSITVAIDRRAYGDRHLEVALDLRRLGSIRVERGDWNSAFATLREADDIFDANQVPLHDERRLEVRADLAAALLALGRQAEAEYALTSALAAAQQAGEAPTDAVRLLRERLESVQAGMRPPRP